MRTVVINDTKPDNVGGVRRGDLYNSIYEYAHGKNSIIDDIQTIWADISDKSKERNLKRLLKWLNYCYHFNQGKAFSVDPGLSYLDALDLDFARRLAKLDDRTSASGVHVQEFQFPTINAMLTVAPERIFALRDFNVGRDYFAAMRKWQTSASDDTAQVLLDRLEAYTDEMTNLYISEGRSILNPFWRLRAAIPSGRYRCWDDVLWEGVKTGTDEVIGALIPGFPFRSVVGKAAAAIYQSLSPKMRDPLSRTMGASDRVRLELDDSVKAVRTKKVAPEPTNTDATFTKSP